MILTAAFIISKAIGATWSWWGLLSQDTIGFRYSPELTDKLNKQ